MRADATEKDDDWRIHAGSGAFYAATAIPMSYFFYLLPAQLRQYEHSAETIGLLALVYLPYALRVLWAPLVDGWCHHRPARYRTVMIAAVLAAAAGTLGLGAVEPTQDVAAIILIAFTIFIALSTGTTALDGYTIAMLGSMARRRASIAQTVGFTTGGIGLGIGAMLTDGFEWRAVTTLIAVTMLVAAIPVLRMPGNRRQAIPPAEQADGVGDRRGLLDFFRRVETRRLLLLSLLVKLGVGMIAGYLPVWQVDAGVSASQAGFFGAVGSNILGLLMALTSGYFLLRWDGWRITAGLCVLAAVVFAFVGLFHTVLAGPVMAVSMSLVFLSIGYAYIAPFKALSLDLSDSEQAATKAAMLASFDLTLSILAASVSGFLVAVLGFGNFLWVSAALCLAGAGTAFAASRNRRCFTKSEYTNERLG
ncbi:MFS transporter [Shinella curvata]|uniref:MFS transporter n=1 Tax=Shinella curvata TaxID=1817964 RepID=A0ABT8XDH0_9HYPH|nr:MFS transporter [Shinella curvata]MCJ8055378.1 MFS transporter [Shinella curvata]MDO6121795.1 MFS transporter [Shinella curvata]